MVVHFPHSLCQAYWQLNWNCKKLQMHKIWQIQESLITLTESLFPLLLYAAFTIASIFSFFRGCRYKLGDMGCFSDIVTWPFFPTLGFIGKVGIFPQGTELSEFLFIAGLWVCGTLGMDPFCLRGRFLPGLVVDGKVGIFLWAISWCGTCCLAFFFY